MKKFILGILLVFPGLASVNFYCSGKLTNVYVSRSGNLVIRGDWRSDYTQLCNLDGKINNISSITCSMWSSIATTALKDKKKVTLSYSDSEGMDCSNIPTYSNSPSPSYFMIREEDIN